MRQPSESFAFTITVNKIKDHLRRRIFRHKMEENAKYEMELQHSHVERMTEYHDTLRMVNDSMANCLQLVPRYIA